MSVPDGAAACVDQGLETAVQKAQAKLAGVEDDAVSMDGCSVTSGSSGRRLADTIAWAYEITVPDEAVAAAIVDKVVAAAADTTSFADSIVSFLPANSSYTDLTVTELKTPEVATLTTTTTASGGDGKSNEFDDSHAYMPAVLGPIFMAAMAAALT